MSQTDISPRKKPKRKTQRRLVKMPCTECTHYRHCPRMRGENVCYGLRVAPQNPATGEPENESDGNEP